MVRWLVKNLAQIFLNEDYKWKMDKRKHPYETMCLKLDASKAKRELGWKPRLKIGEALKKTAHWYAAFLNKKEDMFKFTLEQICEYERLG